MTDTDRILTRIEELDKRLVDRIAALEATVQETRKGQTAQKNKIKALEYNARKQQLDIEDIKKQLDELSHTGALVRREPGRVVLRKEPVYECFLKQGISKGLLLRILDENGLVLRQGTSEKVRTRSVRDYKNGGNVIRALIVLL